MPFNVYTILFILLQDFSYSCRTRRRAEHLTIWRNHQVIRHSIPHLILVEEVIIALGSRDVLRPWLRMLLHRLYPSLLLGIYRNANHRELALVFLSQLLDLWHCSQADATPASPEIHQYILVLGYYINKVAKFPIHVLEFQID